MVDFTDIEPGLIRRLDAVKAIYSSFADRLDPAEVIRALNSCETCRRWIPCSMWLPEKNQMVITTIVGTDVIRMGIGDTFEDAVARVRKNVRVSVGYIEEDGWYGADGYPQIVAPIAWMPMPDPYREEGDD